MSWVKDEHYGENEHPTRNDPLSRVNLAFIQNLHGRGILVCRLGYWDSVPNLFSFYYTSKKFHANSNIKSGQSASCRSAALVIDVQVEMIWKVFEDKRDVVS